MLHNAGFLAQKRLARGVRLNYPESVALIATQLLEFIRDGKSVAELNGLVPSVMPRLSTHVSQSVPLCLSHRGPLPAVGSSVMRKRPMSGSPSAAADEPASAVALLPTVLPGPALVHVGPPQNVWKGLSAPSQK